MPSLDPVDVHGPVSFWAKDEEPLRSWVLATVSKAQGMGDLPPRDSGIPAGSVVIWIGAHAAPDAFATFCVLEGQTTVWLDILYVEPGFRGKGLGLLLLQIVEQASRLNGYKSMQLGTGPLNLAMQRLALKAGWGKRMLVMERKL